MNDERQVAKGLLAEVHRRGLTPHFWDGQLHLLPARQAAMHRDLHAKLLQHREAVLRELKIDHALALFPPLPARTRH